MESIKTVRSILDTISDKLSKLSKNEIQLLINGDADIDILIVRKDVKSKNLRVNDKLGLEKLDTFSKVISRLGEAVSRDAGIIILEEIIPLKNDLESFAKHIDVVVSKSDRVENIKNKIVDATIGAKLRSGAIQGKEVEFCITPSSKNKI